MKHKEIYLEPELCADPTVGSVWCEDSQRCENCGKLWIKYVIWDKELERQPARKPVVDFYNEIPVKPKKEID